MAAIVFVIVIVAIIVVAVVVVILSSSSDLFLLQLRGLRSLRAACKAGPWQRCPNTRMRAIRPPRAARGGPRDELLRSSHSCSKKRVALQVLVKHPSEIFIIE